jgi:hypothetical protein
VKTPSVMSATEFALSSLHLDNLEETTVYLQII